VGKDNVNNEKHKESLKANGSGGKEMREREREREREGGKCKG
jgi:hypothetical protein